MKDYGFLSLFPLACLPLKSGKLWIKKGHHRLYYAKKFKLPVWYIVDPSKQALAITLYQLEGSSRERWSCPDFAGSHAKAGNKDLLKLLEVQKEHSLSFGVVASLLGGESAGSNNKHQDVKMGTFKIDPDGTHAAQVFKITDRCREKGISFAGSRNYAWAVSLACKIPDFNPDRFIKKIDLHWKKLNHRATTDEYLQEIEDLYNYCSGREKRLNVKFMARKLSKERNVAKKKE